MRSTIRGRLLLACACLIGGSHLWGQQDAQSQTSPRLEVAVTYDSLLTNVVRSNRFWMQGGSIEVDGQFWHGLGAERMSPAFTPGMPTTREPRWTW